MDPNFQFNEDLSEFFDGTTVEQLFSQADSGERTHADLDRNIERMQGIQLMEKAKMPIRKKKFSGGPTLPKEKRRRGTKSELSKQPELQKNVSNSDQMRHSPTESESSAPSQENEAASDPVTRTHWKVNIKYNPEEEFPGYVKFEEALKLIRKYGENSKIISTKQLRVMNHFKAHNVFDLCHFLVHFKAAKIIKPTGSFEEPIEGTSSEKAVKPEKEFEYLQLNPDFPFEALEKRKKLQRENLSLEEEEAQIDSLIDSVQKVMDNVASNPYLFVEQQDLGVKENGMVLAKTRGVEYTLNDSSLKLTNAANVVGITKEELNEEFIPLEALTGFSQKEYQSAGIAIDRQFKLKKAEIQEEERKKTVPLEPVVTSLTNQDINGLRHIFMKNRMFQVNDGRSLLQLLLDNGTDPEFIRLISDDPVMPPKRVRKRTEAQLKILRDRYSAKRLAETGIAPKRKRPEESMNEIIKRSEEQTTPKSNENIQNDSVHPNDAGSSRTLVSHNSFLNKDAYPFGGVLPPLQVNQEPAPLIMYPGGNETLDPLNLAPPPTHFDPAYQQWNVPSTSFDNPVSQVPNQQYDCFPNHNYQPEYHQEEPTNSENYEQQNFEYQNNEEEDWNKSIDLGFLEKGLKI